jgi:hypothetical protein
MRLHFRRLGGIPTPRATFTAKDRQLEGADNRYEMTERRGSRHFPRFRSNRMNHFRRLTYIMTWRFRASGRPEIGKDEDSLIFAIRCNRRTIKVVRVLRRATAGSGASLACLPYRRRGRGPSPSDLTGSCMVNLRLPTNGSSSRSQTSREYEVSATN